MSTPKRYRLLRMRQSSGSISAWSTYSLKHLTALLLPSLLFVFHLINGQCHRFLKCLQNKCRTRSKNRRNRLYLFAKQLAERLGVFGADLYPITVLTRDVVHFQNFW